MTNVFIPSPLIRLAPAPIPKAQCFKGPVQRAWTAHRHTSLASGAVRSRALDILPNDAPKQSKPRRRGRAKRPEEQARPQYRSYVRYLLKEQMDRTNDPQRYQMFEEFLASETHDYRPGQKIIGVVTSMHGSEALVDIHDKFLALLPQDELTLEGPGRLDEELAVGMRRAFRLMKPTGDGRQRLSLRAILLKTMYKRIAQCRERNATVVGHVISANRGGITADIDGVAGFCPGPQLPMSPAEFPELVGQTLQFKIHDFNPSTFELALSHVRALNEAPLPKGIQVGDIVEGTVIHVRGFGAFVATTGRGGVVANAQIPPEAMDGDTTRLRPGDRVRVRIVKHLQKQGHLYLSMRSAAEGLAHRGQDPTVWFPLRRQDDDDDQEGEARGGLVSEEEAAEESTAGDDALGEDEALLGGDAGARQNPAIGARQAVASDDDRGDDLEFVHELVDEEGPPPEFEWMDLLEEYRQH